MTVFLIVRGPSQFWMAPPSTSLASVDRPEADPTLLSLSVVFTIVSVPQLSIPPPPACANGRLPLTQVMVMSGGQGMPESIALVGAARLPVMMLCEMVTVAPPVIGRVWRDLQPAAESEHVLCADGEVSILGWIG